MENNQICIWGCRDGFEIIYSENEDWKSYVLKNTNEIDQKFQKLIEGHRKDFYYLSKINGFQVFSYVTHENIDIEARTTYMVISFVSKSGVSYGSELIGVLQNIWNHYQSKNITEKAHLKSEEFSISELRNQANSLMPINSNYSYEKSNCVITIDDETLFQNEFGKFKGDTTYFIYPTNNQAVFNRLPNTIHSLKTLVANKPNTQELVNLKNYIQNKSNFDLASTLYERWKNQLTEQEKTNYSYWKQTVEKQQVEDVTSVKLKSLSGTQTLTESDIIFIRHQVLSESPAFLKLDNHEKNLLQEKIKEKQPPSIDDEIVRVNEQITDAKNKFWTIDYSDLQKEIKNNPKLDDAFKDNSDLKSWIAGFNLDQTKKCEEKINSLHAQIQKIPKNQIESNVRDLKVKLTNLKHQVNKLIDTKAKDKFGTDEKFQYLVSEDWIPKNRKPLYRKLAVTILLLTLTTVGFFALKYIGVGEVEKKSDKDFDGIEDKADEEVNTVWFKDTTNYRVRNYVNVYGKIDTSKTKDLCNCWKFPKAEDRKILLCTDTENWFVFKNILYEYREVSEGDGSFYSAANSKIKSTLDNDVEEFHQQFLQETFPPEDDSTIIPEVSNRVATINYNNKKYNVKIEFTSNEGIEFNDANYRFKNNVWKRQSNPPNGNWTEPNENDISFMFATLKIKPIDVDKCNKCAKPKKDCTCNKPPVENCKKCSKPKKDCTCNKPPVENCNKCAKPKKECTCSKTVVKCDKCAKPKKECTCSKTDHSSYWINLDRLPDAELKGDASAIREKIADEAYKCKPGSPGATARLNIISRLNK